MRRVLWILAPILLLLTIVSQTAELHTLGTIFAGAHPGWLIAALSLQAAFALIQGWQYQTVFHLLDAEVPLGTTVWLSMVMAFGGMSSPVGTATGVAYFVTAARGRGLAGPRALWASLVHFFFDYVAALVVLVAGLAILLFTHELPLRTFAVAAVFYALILGVAFLTVRAIARPAAVPGAFARLADVIDRASRRLRRRPLEREVVTGWGRDLQEVVTAVRGSPQRAVPPFLLALLLQIVALAILAAVFRAIGYPLQATELVVAYAVGLFFMVLSITPSGVGVTEGAMIVTLTSLGVPLEAAVAGTLLYRLFTFWLPILVGFLAMQAVPSPAGGSGGK